jgi:hypothetical protein
VEGLIIGVHWWYIGLGLLGVGSVVVEGMSNLRVTALTIFLSAHIVDKLLSRLDSHRLLDLLYKVLGTDGTIVESLENIIKRTSRFFSEL